MRYHTRPFTVRLAVPGEPRRREIVRVPGGLPCTVSRPKERGDTGAKLMPEYVRLELAEPVAGRTVFYTDERNVDMMQEVV